MFVNAPSILITDDDVGFRETLRTVFEPRGFRTILAGDGEEALQIVHKQEVHLLLLDMHMPKLTGLETLQRVRQFTSRLPCILLSAKLDEVIIRQATLAQAFSVLSKPVTRQQLTNTVEAAIRRTYQWDRRSGAEKRADDEPTAKPPGSVPPESLPNSSFGEQKIQSLQWQLRFNFRQLPKQDDQS